MDAEIWLYISTTLNALLGIAVTVILRIINKHYGIETSDLVLKFRNKDDSGKGT